MKQDIQSYHKYWGKTDSDNNYHLLPYHCLDVAAVGSILLKKDSSLSEQINNITSFHQDILLNWILFFLSLHDIGKFSESFQNLNKELFFKLRNKESDEQYRIRHDSLGYVLWEQVLWKKVWVENWLIDCENGNEERHWRKAFDIIAKAVTGHHGSPPLKRGFNNSPIPAHSYFGREEIADVEAFTHSIARLLIPYNQVQSLMSAREVRKNFELFSWHLAGMVVLCDWIASGFFPYLSEPLSLEDYWHNHALPNAVEAIEETGILPLQPSRLATPKTIFPSIRKFTPLQNEVSQYPVSKEPQLFILEDTTGSGKTEAALILAWRLMKKGLGQGLFIALPTMATSNAMYKRLSSSYRKLFTDDTNPSLILAHSASRYSSDFRQSFSVEDKRRQSKYSEDDEEAAAYCRAWVADNQKKALLADVGTGTLDQVLLAALPSRYQSLRLFGLSRRILIVDEVHAYDPYMNALLQNLLRFHAALGGSAILLSATLPFKIRKELADSFLDGLGVEESLNLNKKALYPLVTHVSQSKCNEVELHKNQKRKIRQQIKLIHKEEIIINLIERSHKEGKTVCWIRNTVYDACAIYDKVKESIPESHLLLFHARFAMGDRSEIEKEVCRTFDNESSAEIRTGKVLIATQVVEQSLDLDFDLLITDLAPMDLLIQRAGRLHRHCRNKYGNPLKDEGSTDQREFPVFYIYSPVPSDNAEKNWYEAFFPKAAYVYPSHGRLWLTAHLLSEKGEWQMPKDARVLIESAYCLDEEEKIPEPLLLRDDEAAVVRSNEKMLAHLNMLKIEQGYRMTPEQWIEDNRTPTRLGELQSTLRLARWDGESLSPWYGSGDFPWQMSQVSFRASLVSEEATPADESLKRAIDSLKTSLPDKGKWSIIVPLTKKSEKIWEGEAVGPDGVKATLRYDLTKGLMKV